MPYDFNFYPPVPVLLSKINLAIESESETIDPTLSTVGVTNIIIDGTIIFDTAGTFTIQFAQGAGQSTACKVLVGSAISLTKIS